MSNVPGRTVRDLHQHIFYILQVRFKNDMKVVKAHIELRDLCSSTHINF